MKKLTIIIELEKSKHKQPLQIQVRIERKIEKLTKQVEQNQKLSEKLVKRTERIKQIKETI